MSTSTLSTLLTLILCLNCFYLSALESSPLTLAELIDTALENNPYTKKVWWQAKRARVAADLTKSAYYPRVDLETFAEHGRDFKYLNGPDTTYTIVGADLILGWMLYDFGVRSAEFEAAKCALVAADWQYNQMLQKVMLDVLERAYAVLHGEEALAATLISCKEAAFMLEIARELNLAGLNPISDVYSSEADYSELQIKMLELRSRLEVERGRLLLILGLSPFDTIELAKIHQLPGQFEPMQDQLLQIAKGKRADLFAKQAKISEEEHLQKKIAAEMRPKLFFSGRAGVNHAFQDRANGGQYGAVLHLNFPLFDGYENCYKLQMKRADVKISEEEVAALELEISFEILKYSTEMQAMQEMFIQAELYLQNSEKAYEGVKEMYKAGIERMSAVSIAHEQLAAARILYSDIKTRWLTSAAYLAFSIGALEDNPCY